VTIEAALDAASARAGRGEVVFPDDLRGFPGTVHGGAVAALVYRLTRPRLPVRLRLQLRRGVPPETPLRLVTGSVGAEARLELWQADRHLAQAELTRQLEAPGADPGPDPTTFGPPEGKMPRTPSCLACGTENPLGLGLQLGWNARWIWQTFEPPESYRTRTGRVDSALATIALDEIGWWLGALAQGECGVTTEIEITLWRPIPGEPLLLVGDRTMVRTDDDPRGRYCRASSGLFTRSGAAVATAEVRFGGSRAYTRRLLQPFLAVTSLPDLARLFPGVPTLAEPAKPPPDGAPV
jgi:hypothetical protein